MGKVGADVKKEVNEQYHANKNNKILFKKIS